MAFIQEAQQFLVERIVPRLQDFLSRAAYVHRLLFHVKADVQEALVRHRLRKTYKVSDEDLQALDDRELARQPRLCVIGNAGSGKSSVLTFGYLEAVQHFLHSPSAPLPFFVDLGKDLPTDFNIERTLRAKYAGLFQRAHSESSAGCALFLDGLDEVLQKTPYFINDLTFFLKEHQPCLARVVLACRRAMWHAEWLTQDPVRLVVYHTDYLDEDAYAQILPDQTTRHAFFVRCHILGIASLLESPFDGFYLARKFRAEQPLPSSRRECLSEQIDAALKGRAVDREEGSAPPVEALRFLARQLACHATFTREDAWTLQDAVDCLGSSQVLRAQRPLHPEDIHTLLQRPLFQRHGDRFSFVHQLYQEYLTAEALTPLPLHKQRQLLELVRLGHTRVQTLHRGIAAFLAETSVAFRDYLIVSDPLVAFFAEMPSLPREQDEQLLRAVLDDAITNSRAPWWELPPRGERPSQALTRHRPQDTAAFLRLYVDSPNQFARLWGTFCAHAWGGSSALNPLLDRLVHDPQEHIDSRKAAIAAIAATRELQAVRALYDLLDDHDDQVRGEVLAAYRQLDSPSPQEFIAQLYGGARTPHAYGRLQTEAESFGRTLDAAQLSEALAAVTVHFESLADLRPFILRGLFQRAVALGFHDIPPALILQCWIAQETRTELRYDPEDVLTKLVKEHPALFERVWRSILQRLNEQSPHFVYLFAPLAKSCTDRIFDLLPATAAGLTRAQESLIIGVLQRYFWQDSTAERLVYFQRVAPVFTQHLRLPAPPKLPQPRDRLHERYQLVKAIETGSTNAIAQTWNVLLATTEITKGVRQRQEITEDAVSTVLDTTIPVIKALVVHAFRDCVAQLPYERKPDAITRPEFAIPFWILRQQGEHFAVQKVAEIAQCYYGYQSDEARYEALLEELRQRDHDLWQQTMLQILDAGLVGLDRPLRYLTTIQEDIYRSQCCERLEHGTVNGINFGPLLEYVYTFRPPRWMETLRRCYNTIRARHRPTAQRRQVPDPDVGAPEPGDPVPLSPWEQFRPLLILMAENDEWAWREFARRLRREDVPRHGALYRDGLRYPLTVERSRLPLIADWYALVCREMSKDAMAVGGGGLAQSLGETLVAIGGEPTIRELRRLQESHAYPEVAWLSHTLLRVEDALFTEGTVSWTSGSLLDFVNKQQFGFIGSEHDLFAWTCLALEEIQDALEKRAEGVAGFWHGQRPKSEPLCQNVLWPLMRLTLQKFGIAVYGGEEKYIGKNRCDFWVEYPCQGASPFRVGIELKIAHARYGPKELVDSIETQLWKKYLRPSGSQHGLFVVLWFRDDQRYHGPRSWRNSTELAAALRKKCAELSRKHHVSLHGYVIDLTTPVRER